MSLQETRKISKSELILRMADPKTRMSTVEWLKKSKKSKIPKSYFTSEEISTIISENALKKEKLAMQDRSECKGFIRAYYNEPKHIIEERLRHLPQVPTNLCFEDRNMQVFYLSIIVRQRRDLKIEHDLMLLLEKLYCEGNDKSFLKYCVCKISKKALAAFLQSNICNFKAIKGFVGFLAPKLQPNVIEIWFDNDFEFIDSLFGRMDVMKLRSDLPFDDRTFSHLLQFKSFRRAIFNGTMNKKFIIGMKEYANRGDFEYFYQHLGIARKLDGHCHAKPRDNSEFEFFSTFEQKSRMHSNLAKLRSYQTRIGHSAILDVFISKNIRLICEYVDKDDIAASIIKDIVIFNSARIKDFEANPEGIDKTDYQESKLHNDIIFEALKRNEDVFRTIVKDFYHPGDQVLQDLLTGDFNFTIEDAAAYINFGYENELIDFYRTKPVGDLLRIVDGWNCGFFLKLLCTVRLDTESAVQVINFIQKSSLSLNKDFIAEIYDKILNISDIEIFDSLAESLKVIYILRNKEFCEEFISRLLNALPIAGDSSIVYSAWIYETLSVYPALRTSFSDKVDGSDILLSIAVLGNIEFDSNNAIESLFLSSFILKQDAFYLFAENFEILLGQILKVLSREEVMSLTEKNYDFQRYFISKTSCVERIMSNLEKDVEFGILEKISFVMSYNLSNNYLCYIIFDKILSLLTSGTSNQKILVLTYINPSVLTRDHILMFINALIPLLNSSNSTVCKLSKIKFNQIRVDTNEIQNILPEIVQTFLDRNHFEVFLKSFKSIQFNNYICFNSLNILLQLFLRNLTENTGECFDILKRLINIMKEKDIRYVSGLIFHNMSLFVVNNSHSTLDALEVASQFCLYTKFEDFGVLLKNLNSLRICIYLVEILKIKGDSALNNQIICHVLGNIRMHEGIGAIHLSKEHGKETFTTVEPAFIAAACELAEFSKYLNVFVPLIKRLFQNDKVEIRQIACKAMKSIMASAGLDEYKHMLNEYLIDCCIHSDHAIRLQCLDIIRYLPIIFILRHDQHSLVKKKAYDIWKERVFNTNKELKNIFGEVLDFIKYKDVKVFCHALKGMVSEVCLKYLSHLECYLRNCNDEGIKEFILVEAANSNKLLAFAVDFCKVHFSSELFSILSRTPALRDEIIDSIDKNILYDICAENSGLAFILFNQTQDPVYIDLISTSQKLEIIKNHHQSYKTVSIADENIIFILQSIESCNAIEDLLVRIHPVFSYYYISVHRVDYGALSRIFERVFSTCPGLDELLIDRNLNYLKNCPFDRVENKLRLILLLLSRSERAFFKRIIELIKDTKLAFPVDQNALYEILGYLFRNMLLASRKDSCAECISIVYKNYKSEMRYFKTIAENTIIEIK